MATLRMCNTNTLLFTDSRILHGVKEILFQHQPGFARLIEAGCGNGELLEAIVKISIQYGLKKILGYGFDPNAGRLHYAGASDVGVNHHKAMTLYQADVSKINQILDAEEMPDLNIVLLSGFLTRAVNEGSREALTILHGLYSIADYICWSGITHPLFFPGLERIFEVHAENYWIENSADEQSSRYVTAKEDDKIMNDCERFVFYKLRKLTLVERLIRAEKEVAKNNGRLDLSYEPKSLKILNRLAPEVLKKVTSVALVNSNFTNYSDLIHLLLKKAANLKAVCLDYGNEYTGLMVGLFPPHITIKFICGTVDEIPVLSVNEAEMLGELFTYDSNIKYRLFHLQKTFRSVLELFINTFYGVYVSSGNEDAKSDFEKHLENIFKFLLEVVCFSNYFQVLSGYVRDYFSWILSKHDYPYPSTIYDLAFFLLGKVFSDKKSFEWFADKVAQHLEIGKHLSWDAKHSFCERAHVSDEEFSKVREHIFNSLPEDESLEVIREEIKQSLPVTEVTSGVSLFFRREEEDGAGVSDASLSRCAAGSLKAS